MTISAEQRQARRDGIGSSDAAAIVLGHDGFRSALDIFCAKTLPLPDDEPDDQRADGNALEPAIRAMASRRLGVAITEDPKTYTSGVMLAHLDGLAADAGGFEAKACDYRKARDLGEPGSDAILRPHLIQVQHAMEVTGLPWMHVGYLISAFDLRLFLVPRDRELGGMIRAGVESFWKDHVLARVPPPATDPASALRFMRAKYPDASAIELQVEPGTSAYEALMDLRSSRQAVKAAKAVEALAAARVQDLMGSARKIVSDMGAVTWANQKGRTAWARVAREAAVPKEIIAKHTGASARKFSPKFNDDADDSAEE